mgnify:CR=1 FL=1
MQKILEEIEEISKNHFLPIIGPVKGGALKELIKKYKPKNVLEIGSLVGYSAILMAVHLPARSKITTIEKSPGFAKIARKNVAKAKLSRKVKVIQGDAINVIPRLKGKFDFIFLDAEKGEYLDYIKLAESRMAKKCVVVADNVKIFRNTLSDYLNYVKSNYKSRTYDFGFDAVEASVKK